MKQTSPSSPSRGSSSSINNSSLFSQLGLRSELCQAVADEGYETPTPIQSQAITPIIEGRDLLGCAQTGTGKTAAFALPILHRLALDDHADKGLRALILTPTRELALQVADSFKTYGQHLKLNTVVVFGGVGIEPQKAALRRKADILVATPGRLLDLMNQRCVRLDAVDIFVLDEADRMLDMGFIHDVKRITVALPAKRQNLLFSATMPKEIQALVDKMLHDPVKVAVSPVSSSNALIDQSAFLVDRANKRELLVHLLKTAPNFNRALVFTRTKSNANRVTDFLCRSNLKAEAIHANKSQSARQRALENFREGTTKILVASDIVARGIDVEGITHVVNFDVPNVPETYVHRIGRTGRAEAKGEAWSLCDQEEVAFLRGIERVIKKQIPILGGHPFVVSWTMDEALRMPKAPAPQRSGGRPPQQRRNQNSSQNNRRR